MGKGQKELQNTATQRSAEQHQSGNDARNRLITGSPDFQAREQLIKDRRNAINTGTIADAKDFIGNRANTAARERDRALKAGVAKTGVAGLASNYADPTKIALADQANKDEFARDSAAQNESDAANYINQTIGMEDQAIGQQIGVDQNIMGNAYGNSNSQLGLASQIAAQRASVLPSIIGAAVPVAAGIASAGMSSGGSWFSRGASGGGGGA